jgi:hypothetical protein
MASSPDDAEYFYRRAADARDLLRHSEDKIVREALATIVRVYEGLAKRAEQFEATARSSSPLWLLCAWQWLPDLADAMVSV